jgi:hypothetical protein
MSEPESRAVVDFTTRHPEIFAWLNLHTFGGVFIRPLGHAADNKMDPQDLALFRQIEQWAEEHTGYPMVSGFEEFLYEPDKPLRGDLTDYAYNQRGCVAYVVELWDLFAKIGMPRPKKFVDYYGKMRRADAVRLAVWDREHNGGKVFPAWRQVQHPQLGAVEVGGIDPRVGVWNPPLDQLATVCQQQSAAFLRVAALAPAVTIGKTRTTALGGGLTKVEIVVENYGYLPSYVLASSKQLDWNEPVYADASGHGCELVDLGTARVELGHLDGWGRGFDDGWNNPSFLRSRGNTGSGRATWVVRGSGVLKVRIGCCRVGFVDHTVEI